MTREERLLADLVGVPSPSGEEGAAAATLCDLLPRFGWEEATVDEAGSVVARRGSGGRELLLLGHLDTVPGGPEVRLEGEVLWGRGSVDAKGPLCALGVSGGRVPVPPGWRVTLVAASGEEADSRGTRYRLPLHAPAACLVGEPTGADGVALSYRGRVLLSLEGEDGGAHRSGDPGPLAAAVRAAAAILEEAEAREGHSGAVLGMEGHEAGRRTARVDLDLRLPQGASVAGCLEWAAEVAARRGLTLRVRDAVEPHGVDRSDPAVQALRVAVRGEGMTPRLLAKQGTADFNLAAAWGCPLAVYGPGDSRMDHTSEERLDLGEYRRALGVLDRALPLLMERA